MVLSLMREGLHSSQLGDGNWTSVAKSEKYMLDALMTGQVLIRLQVVLR